MGNDVFSLWMCKNVYVLKVAVCDYDKEDLTHTHTHTKMFVVKKEVKICNILLVYYNKSEGVTEMFGGKTSK